MYLANTAYFDCCAAFLACSALSIQQRLRFRDATANIAQHSETIF
jgi:hypothetical protein